MAEIRRTALFGKLDSLGYKALENATVFCKMRGNPHVELVHWMHQILVAQDSDVERIIRHFEIDRSRLAADATRALDKLPRGSTSVSSFSLHVEEAVERAWVYSTLLFGDSFVRTGHILVGIVKTPSLREVLSGISKEFEKISVEKLTDRFADITKDSPEQSSGASDGSQVSSAAAAAGEEGAAPAEMGRQEALAKFSVDLTEKARKGEMDPIVGRDEEIRQIVDILMRRRQNNPILTGEAGVGKTAVVEGFAQRIAAGDVPPAMRDVTLRSLDLGLLQAGASVKGEFEKRLRQVIEEVQASPKPIILFIDEAHTLIGAGGTAGQGDAANLLKPALARGTLRTIAATTWSEYKKYFEKDPALTRRFQVIQVDEPSEEKALLMMRNLASVLEKHHRVELLDEALESAVQLSHRYIPARQLPDKAVSLIDTACARVAISQHATPAQVEDCSRRISALETELGILEREISMGGEHAERRADVVSRLESEREELAQLEKNWEEERGLVTEILSIRAKLRELGAAKMPTTAGTGEAETGEAGADAPAEASSGTDAGQAADSDCGCGEAEAGGAVEAEEAAGTQEAIEGGDEGAELLKKLRELQARLKEFQGDSPLILPSVDAQAVASVVGDWTGIPVGRMVKDEISAVLNLTDVLGERVIGQRQALEAMVKRIRTSRAGLLDPKRPIGVFMLAGPSGVGKTETALAMAEALYGGEQNLITINMSEFQESHTVSTLKGAPPGYVGYGEGGVLTEAVRRKPYSVVLLDEVEKAHRDVHEIFFQVFDKGWMEDGEGRMIDFKNTVILLTTNVGSEQIMRRTGDPSNMPDPTELAADLRSDLLQVFPAAFLGRLVVIPYYPISDEVLRLIIKLQLGRIKRRVRENQNIAFVYSDEVVDVIASRCTDLESGARVVDSILTHTLLPDISKEYLGRLMDGAMVSRVEVAVENSDFTYFFE